jgi:hypothetical protein
MSKSSKRRTPAQLMLATVLNEKLPHRTRAFEARKMLRRGYCVGRALKVLENLVHAPDKSLHGKALYKAIECLASESQNYGPQTMLLSESWRGLIGGLAGTKVKWVPDAELARTPKHIRFPESVERIYTKKPKER